MSGTCNEAFVELQVETEHSDGTPPPLVIWLDRKFRIPTLTVNGNPTANFGICEDLMAWLKYNMRERHAIVRVGWHHKRHQYRYGIQFGSDRDFVLFKLFHG
jgi:hypothetical protein